MMLLLLAGLTLWLERTSQPENVVSGKTRHDPDYIVNNFTIRRFDAQGKLFQTLSAKEMRHYPDDDSTEADLPHPKTFGNPWASCKDGKCYFEDRDPKLMRK